LAYPINQMGGIRVYGGTSDVFARCPINAYSTLSVPAYWRAMTFLSDNLTSFPRTVQKDGIDVPHPLDNVLTRRPNAYQSASTFWRALFFARSHRGNGYAQIRRTTLGRVDTLHNLTTDDVTPFRIDRGDGPEQWYYHLPTKSFVAAADMIHLAGLSYDGESGFDPTSVHASTFERAKAIGDHLSQYLLKGSVLKGSVEFPLEATKEKIEEVLDVLGRYSGPNAEGDVIVLGGGAHLNNATLTPQAGQLIEQARQINNEFARITGVPPQFLYEFSESKYNNAIDAGQDVVRHTFRTLIESIEDELSLKLLTDQERAAGNTINLDPNALLRGDPKAQAEIAVALKTGGIASTNEAREDVGLPADADPESDKVKTLGDTTPQAAPTPPTKSSTDRRADTFAAMRPVIDAAVERIETKTAKAFDNHGQKPDAEKTVWANVFASQQEGHVIETLRPVADVLATLTGVNLDVAKIADRYAAQVRRRAATGEETGLAKIIADQIGGGNNDQQPE
jgi:HK97 family phage portal protein